MPKKTLHLDDSILEALKLKATETKQSMSELVDDALKASLREDLEDIKSWEERKCEDTYDYEEFLELLKKEEVIYKMLNLINPLKTLSNSTYQFFTDYNYHK
jgi:hypothetical protein